MQSEQNIRSQEETPSDAPSLPGPSREKIKKLKHVKVYDRLYAMLLDGTYPEGSRLPSEPELASRMGVSRMTLRRALALLQEDGLVKNIRGRGNYVRSLNIRPDAGENRGMEQLKNPVPACMREIPDSVELELRIEPPTDHMAKALRKRSAAVVVADRWHKIKGKPEGYSLTFLPIELVLSQKLDLSRPEELLQFLEHKIYQSASSSVLHFSHTRTGNFTALKYTLAPDGSFILIQETVYDSRGEVMAFSKHYLPLSQFELSIVSRKGTDA